MPVKAADPDAQTLTDAFADAMGAPARPKDPPPQGEIDPEAPHGRDGDGKPLAPFGLTAEGRPRRSNAGRKRKDPDDAPRTVKPDAGGGQAPDGAEGHALEPRDFSAPLMDAGESLWFGGSVLARVGPQVPLVGRFVPGKKLAATMAVFDSERPRLAAALNEAAQHDKRARRLAEKLATGDVGWALTCMFMVAPFTGAVAAIWQGDDALKERELPTLAELATTNEKAMDAMLARISQQMELAQQLAAQQQQAAMVGDLGAVQEQLAAAAAAQNGQVTHA